MPKVFLDANILFAAAYSPEGRISLIFELAALRVCRLITSSFAVEEARRNLSVKRPESLSSFTAFTKQIDMVPEADPALAEPLARLLPTKDRPILAAAITSRADWLVTGDRQHFGALYGKVVEGVEVVHPAEALRRLVEDAESNGPPPVARPRP